MPHQKLTKEMKERYKETLKWLFFFDVVILIAVGLWAIFA